MSNMKNENRHREILKVRYQLEAAHRQKFLDSLWPRFREGPVEEYLDERLGWEDLLSLAEEELKGHRACEREILGEYGTPKDPETGSSGDVSESSKRLGPERNIATKLPEREKQRNAVLLKIGMRKAAERPDVKRFRDERLGDQRVVVDEAEAFISPGLSEEIIDWELEDLARRLERDYGWRRNDAAWFVLNGAKPRLRPLSTRVSVHRGQYGPSFCEITLKVAPWMPSEEVANAFLQARDMVRSGSGPGTVGERKLEVLRFVEEEYEKQGRQPTFEELLQIWNQQCPPHWTYSSYEALSKAYREAFREVLYPEYRFPPH